MTDPDTSADTVERAISMARAVYVIDTLRALAAENDDLRARAEAAEADVERLRKAINRVGALACQRASHALIIDALLAGIAPRQEPTHD